MIKWLGGVLVAWDVWCMVVVWCEGGTVVAMRDRARDFNKKQE